MPQDEITYIKDFLTQKTIGFLRKRPNGDIEAVEFSSRKILGFYRAKLNYTTDFLGRMLTKGDTTAALIQNAWNEKQAKKKTK